MPAAMWKTFGSEDHTGVLMVDGSRVYSIANDFRADLDASTPAALEALGRALAPAPRLDMTVPDPPEPQNISLNISSACNLTCAYCYAGRGGFDGKQIGPMGWTTARAAIDRLLTVSLPGAPVTIGFLGGEPFVNRKLLHKATRYATEQGVARGRDVRFSVTTNGTLLNCDDLQLLRSHPFAVTVSIDGGRDTQTRQRPGTDYDQLRRNIEDLVGRPGNARICARATVTRTDLDVPRRFDEIRALGFEDIGFAPVRTGPANECLSGNDWNGYLDAIRTLGVRELDRLLDNRISAFSNLVIALKQIRRGTASPYPCGAGGGYFSVATDGRWYACHRAIGDSRFEMGDSGGLDIARRRAFLRQRHVHAQTDCRTCWARYLCSGGCHQEAEARSAESCNFIRGWLEFCLEAYLRLENAGQQCFDTEVTI